MNAIELNHVTKSYPDFTLEDITLNLPEGMIMGLIGENGAGKTTLLRAVLGMHPIDRGSFSILGCSDPRHNKEIMNDIGCVLDENGLPATLTLVDFGIMFSSIFKNWDNTLYSSLLKRFEVPADRRFHELSKGNRMKANIICALAHHPKLLILDEATGGLDPVVRDDMLELFMDFTRDEHHSILMSSHIISDLEKACDLVAFLHKGKLLLCEEKDTLRDSCCVIRCTKESLGTIDPAAVIGVRENAYGVEAVIRKDALKDNMESSPAELEELFVMMMKGGKQK